MNFQMLKTILLQLLLQLGLLFEPKDLQVDIILRLINGDNVIALLPTGYGKTLLYQLYPLLPDIDGFALVVSPLKGLVRDQINRCSKIGMKTAELEMDGRQQLKGKLNISWKLQEGS